MKQFGLHSFFHDASNTISHLVWDLETRQAALIDSVLDFSQASGATACDSAQLILDYIVNNSLELRYALETHVHADHLSAAPFFRQHCSAEIIVGQDIRLVEKAFAPIFNLDEQLQSPQIQFFDRFVVDKDSLQLGALEIQVISTPGHTAGCVSYLVEDAAFVGDTLFMPDFGTARADFPGGDARVLYRSIQKILSLPPQTRLFMCHDYKASGRDEFAWETTVEEQRSTNIHLKDGVSEDEYVAFRTERDAKLSMPALLLPSVQVNLRAGMLPNAKANGIQYLKIPLNQF